jgi:hypothetical protein
MNYSPVIPLFDASLIMTASLTKPYVNPQALCNHLSLLLVRVVVRSVPALGLRVSNRPYV